MVINQNSLGNIGTISLIPVTYKHTVLERTDYNDISHIEVPRFLILRVENFNLLKDTLLRKHTVLGTVSLALKEFELLKDHTGSCFFNFLKNQELCSSVILLNAANMLLLVKPTEYKFPSLLISLGYEDLYNSMIPYAISTDKGLLIDLDANKHYFNSTDKVNIKKYLHM